MNENNIPQDEYDRNVSEADAIAAGQYQIWKDSMLPHQAQISGATMVMMQLITDTYNADYEVGEEVLRMTMEILQSIRKKKIYGPDGKAIAV